ncbi:MAG: hypothetical protein A2107_11265 [Verrucomicrobia bacterium GWF2_62_7]|nr:MAG: hypothetical protein A2107_11265 [Verrucomicrobia bacterium GWF2_62_7]
MECSKSGVLELWSIGVKKQGMRISECGMGRKFRQSREDAGRSLGKKRGSDGNAVELRWRRWVMSLAVAIVAAG